MIRVGNGISFRKIPRNRLGTVSVIPQQQKNVTKWFVCTSKVSFLTLYRAFREYISIFCCTERNSEFCSLPRNGSERNSENLLLFQFHGTEFRVVFSSEEGFGTELWEFISIFGQRNGIPRCFFFRGRVRNGIPRFSVPRNNRNFVGNNHLFRLFRLPRNNFFVGNSQP